MKADDAVSAFFGTDVPDETTPGVVLVEQGEASKVTAERINAGWRVVDWELIRFNGKPYWLPKDTRTVLCPKRQHQAPERVQ